MKLHFHKYQGTGNDFIMVDQRNQQYLHHDDHKKIRQLCDRRFGIGADGLILLENAADTDFTMIYYNADGRQGSMCGNGGRCILAFAHALGVFRKECTFSAIDGDHQGKIDEQGIVSLHMQDVNRIQRLNNDTYELNTGSPHFVTFCDEIPSNIAIEGAKIRYNETYKKEGINVNFSKIIDTDITVATYERGVEDETYSCGTGVTAVALSFSLKQNLHGKNIIQITTKGGHLKVEFERILDNQFTNIWLSGPAEKVYEGEILV
jgi:diaminopimelate epimerase